MANEQSLEQYLRSCTLLVSDKQGKALDLSALRIKFCIKRSDAMTPNMADIRVYNLKEETAIQIKKEFTKVFFDAGYVFNRGGIFKGNIKQVIIGRESATDTFIDLVCGDGDTAYNFTLINQTLAEGSASTDQVSALINAMKLKGGVGAGVVDSDSGTKLPRGKVMWGNAKDYLRSTAISTGRSWSIQDEKINFIKKTGYLPGTAVVLTSKTGMIGTPQQTNEGLNVKCLLNPLMRIGGRVKIDNKSVALFKINLAVAGSPANTPPQLNHDGVYYILAIEHSGDTRGVEWYSSLICIATDVTSNPLNSVQVSYGP